MKKILPLLMLLLLTCAVVMTGCGSTDSESQTGSQVSVDSLETIGDIIAMAPEELQTAVYDDKVVYAFRVDDTYYRAIAKISAEDAEKYIAIDFSEDDAEQQQQAIVSPLKIEKMENLSEQIIPQEELDALVGKTGKELVSEGWVYTGTYFLEDMSVEMGKGPFYYSIVFDGELDDSNGEDIDIEKETAGMKVKSATFSTIGDATQVE